MKNNIGIKWRTETTFENVLAEKINGIIKQRSISTVVHLGFGQTSKQISKNIQSYNELRPHASCNYLTPEQAHLQSGILKKRWKTIIRLLLWKTGYIVILGLSIIVV